MTTKRPRRSAAPRAAQVPRKAAPAAEAGFSVPAQRETLVPLSSRAIFWPPRYLAPSSTLVHVPFLFWLVETISPRSVVQLGIGDGVGFMALCQAIDKLGLETVCMGVDLVREEDGKPAEKLSEKLSDSHNALYSDFSFVVQDKAGHAARHMRQTRLDLLVIDCPVDDTLLGSLQAHWQPLLSENAVLVVQQPQRNLSEPAAQRFVDDLSSAHPSIRFPQSETGLDVILTGTSQPERLLQLAQLDLGTPGYLTARQVFTRLGQGVEHAQQTRSKSGLLDKTRAELRNAQAEIEKLQEAREKLARDVSAAQETEAAQVTANAVLQSRIFDLSQELDAARARTASRQELEKTRAELQSAVARLADLETALSESEQERETLTKKADSLSADKSALETRLAEAEAAAQALTAQSSEVQAKLEQSQEKRLALWEAHETLKLQHEALLRRSAATAAPADPGDTDDT